MPNISLVMTTFNRPALLESTLLSIKQQNVPDLDVVVVDDGDDDYTPIVCTDHNVRYYKLNRPQSDTYRNQSVPLNIGIRQAIGDIIILQNAECEHVGDVILPLASQVTDTNAVFAKVVALDPTRTESTLYCGKDNPRPYFFCGAIKKHWFEKLRGFDEDYVGYGFEDDDMADRLWREGVRWVFTDLLVHHQWHPPAGVCDMSETSKLFERKRNEPTIRNLEKEWGKL